MFTFLCKEDNRLCISRVILVAKLTGNELEAFGIFYLPFSEPFFFFFYFLVSDLNLYLRMGFLNFKKVTASHWSFYSVFCFFFHISRIFISLGKACTDKVLKKQ